MITHAPDAEAPARAAEVEPGYGFCFDETMEGTAQREGEWFTRPFRFDLHAESASLPTASGTAHCRTTGQVFLSGVADGVPAEGTLEISPIEGRRLGYTLDFTSDDGRRFHFEGHKTITFRHPVRSFTVLPGVLLVADGTVWGRAQVRFSLRHLGAFLASFDLLRPGRGETVELPARPRERPPLAPVPEAGLDASRWRGQPERLEVWYTTLTDPRTGTGFWIHHELLVSVDGEAVVHGWAAVFPPGEAPEVARFGPAPLAATEPAPIDTPVSFEAPGVFAAPNRLRGTAGPIQWDLEYHDDAAPLFTFPRWVWERELLPAAQVVPAPTATFSGTVVAGAREIQLEAARGGVSRIYGHGNAQEWGWLHADLGDGDVLEIVAARSRRPGLRAVRPLPFVQLRHAGRDWPRDPLAAAPRFRAELGLPTWSVTGTSGRRRLRVEVTLPEDASVALEYRDPDGATLTCTNSELARAEIVLERKARDWELERRWSLDATAHAEIGSRE